MTLVTASPSGNQTHNEYVTENQIQLQPPPRVVVLVDDVEQPVINETVSATIIDVVFDDAEPEQSKLPIADNSVVSSDQTANLSINDSSSSSNSVVLEKIWAPETISKYLRIFSMLVRHGDAYYISHEPWKAFQGLQLYNEDYETVHENDFHCFKFNAKKNEVLTAAYQSEGYLTNSMNAEAFIPTLTEHLLFHEFKTGRLGIFFKSGDVIGSNKNQEINAEELNVHNIKFQYHFYDQNSEDENNCVGVKGYYDTKKSELVNYIAKIYHERLKKRIDEAARWRKAYKFIDLHIPSTKELDREMLALTAFRNILNSQLSSYGSLEGAESLTKIFSIPKRYWNDLSQNSKNMIINKGYKVEDYESPRDQDYLRVRFTVNM